MSKKRDKVLMAAREVFLEEGYGGASMDAISQRAGVSKATVYAHFSSKEKLFTEMVREYCREQQAAVEEIEAGHFALEEGLRRIALAVMKYLTHPNALAFGKMIIGEATRFPELGRAFVESGSIELQKTIAGYLERSMTRKNALKDPLLTAELFLGMIRSAITQRSLLALGKPPSKAQMTRIADAAAQLVSSSLVAAG